MAKLGQLVLCTVRRLAHQPSRQARTNQKAKLCCLKSLNTLLMPGEGKQSRCLPPCMPSVTLSADIAAQAHMEREDSPGDLVCI